jgi:N-acetylglucosaminyl-diphospho-decaprenol L-rhamnosyltransferase
MHARPGVPCAGKTLDELTVVVVNWGTPDLTLRCIRGLLDDGVPPERVVLVDNGSEDDSYARFQTDLPACVLVRIEENAGYVPAANAGARALEGTAYLFVNNDAFVQRRGSVGALVRCLSNDLVGVVVPRILNEDLTLQPTVHPIPTPAVALCLATGLGRLLPNRWQPNWGRHWDHSGSRAVAAASAVVMLVRGEVWTSLRGFYESPLLYSEDIDLCWRAAMRGWKVWFTPEAEFVHLRASTTSRHFGERKRSEMIAGAEAAMIRRNLPPIASRTALASIACGLAARSILYAATGRPEASARARAALRGHLGC